MKFSVKCLQIGLTIFLLSTYVPLNAVRGATGKSTCRDKRYEARISVIPQSVIDEWKAREQAPEVIAPNYVNEADKQQEDVEPIFERNVYIEPNGLVKDALKKAEEMLNELAPPEQILEPEAKQAEDEIQPEVVAVVPPAAAEIQKYAERATGCKVTIRGGLPNPEPVYMKSGSNQFYPYDASGVMVFAAGDKLDLYCPKSFSSISKSLITASCVSDTNFKVDGTTYSFKELTCTSWPAYTAEKTGATCEGGVAVRVGFKISTSRFIEQYNLCFNEDEEVTRYVHHTLNPGSNFYEHGVERLTFQTSNFFNGKKVDNLYKTANQIAAINSDLGGVADKYFQASKSIFLARGHMAAKADFDYAAQQRATFLFVNVAPQWQVFNAGNWAKVEDGVRAKVSKAGWYVDCYTGVYGVTTLPNKDGVETPLYLTHDANNNGLIPVPMLYFRVVIERTSKKGIVFIGVNNPHLTLQQIQADYILCTDVADRVNYIKWKRTDLTAGYSYACEKKGNQIDNVAIDGRQASSVLDVSKIRDPNIDSDHYLVAAKIRRRFGTAKNVHLKAQGKLQSQ